MWQMPTALVMKVWNDLARTFNFLLTFDSTPSNNVQIAFGHDVGEGGFLIAVAYGGTKLSSALFHSPLRGSAWVSPSAFTTSFTTNRIAAGFALVATATNAAHNVSVPSNVIARVMLDEPLVKGIPVLIISNWKNECRQWKYCCYKKLGYDKFV